MPFKPLRLFIEKEKDKPRSEVKSYQVPSVKEGNQLTTLPKRDPPSGWRRILLEDDIAPLTGDVWSGYSTAPGDVAIKSPSTGKALKIQFVDIWNKSGGDASVALKFTVTGERFFWNVLVDKTGVSRNLTNAHIVGGVDETLFLNTDQPWVYYTVVGSEV